MTDSPWVGDNFSLSHIGRSDKECYTVLQSIYMHPRVNLRVDVALDSNDREKTFNERFYGAVEGNYIKINNNASELYKAARNGNVDLINDLVKTKHFYVNILDCYNQTPLHYAAYYSQFTALQTLIRLGSDTRIMDSHGRIARDLLFVSEHPHFNALTRIV